LATKRADGQQIMQEAKRAGVLVGCAPDTFLGAGLQASRFLIDEGAIGQPVAATAFFMSAGPDCWHPNPAFFYQPGGGPLFDMAPYYLTALIHLLGPAEYLSADSHVSFPERVAGHPDIKGERIPVEVPTFISSLLSFSGRVPVTLITTFDVWASEVPRIEIYGSDGSLSLPDPNTFGGPVRLRQKDDDEWREMPLVGWGEAARGIGLADLAHAVVSGRNHRASGEMAFHVLDIMESIIESASSGQRIYLDSPPVRPAPLPADLPARRLDD
jgi:predicted dehydrogenase